MVDIAQLAGRGTFDEFIRHYTPGLATSWRGYEGMTLLHDALANYDVAERLSISSFLLDEGADASAIAMREQFTVLHMLFSRHDHDFEAEAPLLERLLDAGADINHVAGGRWGTPIQTLAAKLAFDDDEFAPFYDVIFARPDVDLLKPGLRGRSDLESARRMERHGLVARMEAYLRDQGREVPETLRE